jgi:hypothetical protein
MFAAIGRGLAESRIPLDIIGLLDGMSEISSEEMRALGIYQTPFPRLRYSGGVIALSLLCNVGTVKSFDQISQGQVGLEGSVGLLHSLEVNCHDTSIQGL